LLGTDELYLPNTLLGRDRPGSPSHAPLKRHSKINCVKCRKKEGSHCYRHRPTPTPTGCDEDRGRRCVSCSIPRFFNFFETAVDRALRDFLCVSTVQYRNKKQPCSDVTFELFGVCCTTRSAATVNQWPPRRPTSARRLARGTRIGAVGRSRKPWNTAEWYQG